MDIHGEEDWLWYEEAASIDGVVAEWFCCTDMAGTSGQLSPALLALVRLIPLSNVYSVSTAGYLSDRMADLGAGIA
ncbi:hypothetical protein D3C76_1394930 [compost metagenome]